jgi:hypothetical protein
MQRLSESGAGWVGVRGGREIRPWHIACAREGCVPSGTPAPPLVPRVPCPRALHPPRTLRELLRVEPRLAPERALRLLADLAIARASAARPRLGVRGADPRARPARPRRARHARRAVAGRRRGRGAAVAHLPRPRADRRRAPRPTERRLRAGARGMGDARRAAAVGGGVTLRRRGQAARARPAAPLDAAPGLPRGLVQAVEGRCTSIRGPLAARRRAAARAGHGTRRRERGRDADDGRPRSTRPGPCRRTGRRPCLRSPTPTPTPAGRCPTVAVDRAGRGRRGGGAAARDSPTSPPRRVEPAARPMLPPRAAHSADDLDEIEEATVVSTGGVPRAPRRRRPMALAVLGGLSSGRARPDWSRCRGDRSRARRSAWLDSLSTASAGEIVIEDSVEARKAATSARRDSLARVARARAAARRDSIRRAPPPFRGCGRHRCRGRRHPRRRAGRRAGRRGAATPDVGTGGSGACASPTTADQRACLLALLEEEDTRLTRSYNGSSPTCGAATATGSRPRSSAARRAACLAGRARRDVRAPVACERRGALGAGARALPGGARRGPGGGAGRAPPQLRMGTPGTRAD